MELSVCKNPSIYITCTTISTHRGLYEYVHLPFGIHSAVSTMETLLAGLEGCIVYVDDILITGRNDEEHKTNLEQVLQRLQQAGIRLNPEKAQFMQSQCFSTQSQLSRSHNSLIKDN